MSEAVRKIVHYWMYEVLPDLDDSSLEASTHLVEAGKQLLVTEIVQHVEQWLVNYVRKHSADIDQDEFLDFAKSYDLDALTKALS